jgi:hypothetical protein
MTSQAVPDIEALQIPVGSMLAYPLPLSQ